MRARLPIAARLLVLLSLTACASDDPTRLVSYCDETGDCGVPGVDLALVEAFIDFDDDQPFEDDVDANVVAPDDVIDLRVHLVNRGTDPTVPALIRVDDTLGDSLAVAPVPVLDGGEERVVTVEVTLPQLRMWREMEYALVIEIGTDTSIAYADGDVENNYPQSGDGLTFHPRVPILEFELALPDTIRSLQQHIFSGTVHNRSPFVASTDLPFGVCIYPGNVVCEDQPDGPLGSTGIVNANSSNVVAVGLEAPMEWGVDLNHPEQPAWVSICIPDAAGWATGIMCVPDFYEVVLMPNLAEECEAPALVAPATFHSEATEAACQLNDSGAQQFLWSLDADDGDTFRFTAQGADHTGLRVFDVEGNLLATSSLAAPFEFTAPASATFYLLTGSAFPPGGADILVEEL